MMKISKLFREFSFQTVYSVTWRRAKRFLGKIRNTCNMDLFINPFSLLIYLAVLLSAVGVSIYKLKYQK